MPEKKNALAELARRFDGLYNEIYCYIGHAEAEDYFKALRIIAELAKVKLNGVGWPARIELADAYDNCRAIAEEGANNAD